MPVVGRVISTYLTTYFMLSIVLMILLNFIYWRLNWWSNLLFPLLSILTIQCLYKIGHGQEVTLTIYGGLLSLCPILIGLRMQTMPSRQQKTLFRVMSIAVIITIITTISGLSTHHGAARILATIEDSNDLRLIQFEWLNIGGFSFTYILLTLYPIIIGFIKETCNKLWVKVLIIWLIATYYIEAEYMTGLMGFIVISSLWFMPKRTSVKNLFTLIIFLLIFIVVFKDVIANVMYDSATSSESVILKERFSYMADGLSGVENTSDAKLREDVLMESLNGFLASPVLGNWYKGGGVGGHSYILDFMSLYGLVGLILLVKSYKVIFRQFYLKYKGTSYYSYAIMAFFTAIVLSTVNTGNHWLELTLLIPLALKIIEIVKATRT